MIHLLEAVGREVEVEPHARERQHELVDRRIRVVILVYLPKTTLHANDGSGSQGYRLLWTMTLPYRRNAHGKNKI